MMFSNNSTKTGLIDDITFLLGIDVNAYPLLDRTRNINERYKMVWQMIFEAYGGWKFQDDNLNTVPYADQTLTSGTATYTLPTGALTINMAEIMDSNSIWSRLIPITEEEYNKMGADASNTTSSIPVYYMPYEDTIKLIPTPNYTVASGLRVYFDQGVSEFVYTDTTKTPGFASPFHRMLSIGAALDYALANDIGNKVIYLQNLWNDYERRLKEFYSKRYHDRYPHKIRRGIDLMEEFS
jgi:hypothetical protein